MKPCLVDHTQLCEAPGVSVGNTVAPVRQQGPGNSARGAGTQRLGGAHPPGAAGVDGTVAEVTRGFPRAETGPSSPGPLEERRSLQEKGVEAVRRRRPSDTPSGVLCQHTLRLPGDRHPLRQFSGDPCPEQRCVVLLQKTLPGSPGLPVSRRPPPWNPAPRGSPGAPRLQVLGIPQTPRAGCKRRMSKADRD